MRISNKLNSEKELKLKITKLPIDKTPIIIAGGSFNSKDRTTRMTEEGKNILEEIIKKIDAKKAYFVIGHSMQGYEKAIVDISRKLNKDIEIDAIIPKEISKEVKESLTDKSLNGVCISTESEEMGIYKSFNYEIFERRSSVVLAFDGNSAVANLVQEAKNGKGKSKIYVNEETPALQDKAKSLDGYVIPFNLKQNIADKILQDNPEIFDINNN